MRFLHTYHLNLGNPLMMLWFILWYRTPDRSKRICVLASLYARLMQVDEDDLDKLSRLNNDLGLSRDARSLRLPALLSRWIWRNILPLQHVDLRNRDHYVARLMKKTPCWLWYADQETRQADLQRLLDLCLTQRRTA